MNPTEFFEAITELLETLKIPYETKEIDTTMIIEYEEENYGK